MERRKNQQVRKNNGSRAEQEEGSHRIGATLTEVYRHRQLVREVTWDPSNAQTRQQYSAELTGSGRLYVWQEPAAVDGGVADVQALDEVDEGPPCDLHLSQPISTHGFGRLTGVIGIVGQKFCLSAQAEFFLKGGSKQRDVLLTRRRGHGQGWICTRSGRDFLGAPECHREGRIECERRRFANSPTPMEPLTK